MKPLSVRFLDHWEAQGWTLPGDRVAVACSGGLDSLVLLHLLRFSAPQLDVQLTTAHFDHGMRPGSASDAEWLRGLVGAWGVPLHRERATKTPGSEAAARVLRYGFLEGLVRSNEVDWVLTAHQADDQVETVLFRILRGTGLDGLRGIPASRDPGILRPLLPFTRTDLEEYARVSHLRPRIDPTNACTRFARNRVRHQLLPLLEDVHPGARGALLRLARNSKRTTEALDALVDLHLERVMVEKEGSQIVLDRAAVVEYPDSVIGALIRRATTVLGLGLSEAGTASAVEFIRTGSNGARVDLPGPLSLAREFGQLWVSDSGSGLRGATEEVAEKQLLDIETPGSGEGEVCLSGRRFQVRWGLMSGPGRGEGLEDGWEWAEFLPDDLSFPLRIRGWHPGDRIRISGGRKKLKKVFRESQVSLSERRRLPLIVDSEGLVVWLLGRASTLGAHGGEEGGWRFGVRDLGNV